MLVAERTRIGRAVAPWACVALVVTLLALAPPSTADAAPDEPSFEIATVDLEALPPSASASAEPTHVHAPGEPEHAPARPVEDLAGDPDAARDVAAPMPLRPGIHPTTTEPPSGAAMPEHRRAVLAADDAHAHGRLLQAGCVCPGWSRQVELPIDGEQFFLRWTGSPDLAIQIRSHDEDWTDWVDVHLDPDEAPDEGTEGDGESHSLGPVWVGPGTDRVELYLEQGEPEDFEMEVLKSVTPEGWEDAPERTLMAPSSEGPEGGTLSLGAGTAGAAQPPIISRFAWGSTGWRSSNSGCSGGPFAASGIRFAVVHHTVTTNTYTPSQSYDIVRAIYHGHTNNNGWCDIGYNFLVDKYGQIFEGRTQSVIRPIIGGHARGFNSGSVGVALLGQHHPGALPAATAVSTAARISIASVLAWKFDQYDVDAFGTTSEVSGGSTSIPAGVRVTLNTISGHRDVGATSCPGNNAYLLLGQLRSDTDARQVGRWWRFSDVPPSHTFFEAIEWIAGGGITSGFSDGTYRPTHWITRQAAIAFLYRFAASPPGWFPNPGFHDVATSHPFYREIAWAAHRGITTGFPDGGFHSLMWVSRQAMAVYLYRLMSSPAGPFPPPGFSDVPLSHPFYQEIAWAKHVGVIKGFSDGTFRGDQPVTRQAAASFLFQLAKLF